MNASGGVLPWLLLDTPSPARSLLFKVVLR
jgi:hypothetical protein